MLDFLRQIDALQLRPPELSVGHPSDHLEELREGGISVPFLVLFILERNGLLGHAEIK